jgi:hypothetical protein
MAGLTLLALGASPPATRAASGEPYWHFATGSPGLDDKITSATSGPAGTVYLTGYSDDSFPAQGRFSMGRMRAKVTALNPTIVPRVPLPDTPFLWQRWWENPGWTDRGHLVTMDRAGNAIYVGSTLYPYGDEDWLVVKRSPGGAQRWAVSYDGGHSADDQPWAVGTDAAGNVYVLGVSTLSDTETDWVVRKYRANGIFAWSFSLHGVPTPQGVNLNEPWTIAVAADGTSYVGGSLQSGTPAMNGAILKLSSGGKRVWLRTLGSGSVSTRDVKRLVLRDGRLFVAGHMLLQSGERLPVVARYTTGGRRLWLRTWPGVVGSTAAWVNDMMVDGLGNPAIAGATRIGQQEYKAFVVSWKPSGAKRWQRTYWKEIGPGSRYSSIEALTADGRGNLWGAGFVYAEPASSDALLLRISPTGRLLWARNYDGGGHRDDIFYAVALYGRNAVVAGGVAQAPASDDDLLLAAYRR